MKLNVPGHLKCWLWHLASPLWAEHKFNSGVKRLRLRRCHWRWWFWVIVESERELADDVGISFGSCQLIFTYVLGMKRANFAPW